MFRVGQRVVAITNPKNSLCQQRIKGQIYTVLDVMYCPKTGKQNIYIGGYTKGSMDHLKCSYCGGIHDAYGKSWTRSDHFRPLELDHAFVEEVIKKVTPKEVEV